jgi:hypothetical protein
MTCGKIFHLKIKQKSPCKNIAFSDNTRTGNRIWFKLLVSKYVNHMGTDEQTKVLLSSQPNLKLNMQSYASCYSLYYKLYAVLAFLVHR